MACFPLTLCNKVSMKTGKCKKLLCIKREQSRFPRGILTYAFGGSRVTPDIWICVQ